jgi:hypothetical protein
MHPQIVVKKISKGIYLFIYFGLETAPFIPKGYVAKEDKGNQPPAGELQQKRSSAPALRCAQVPGYGWVPLSKGIQLVHLHTISFT